MLQRILASAFVVLLTSPLLANPHDEVLSHVPPKTAVCIVVRDLSAHVKQLSESPFTQWFKTTAIGKKLRDSLDPEKAGEFVQMLKAQFGLTPEDLLNDVFGDAVAFAFSPGPPERSLILMKPRKIEVATKFFTKLDELQKQGGELESIAKETHNGVSYTARRKNEGSAEAYLIRDGILAFASDEASLKSYIDSRVNRVKPAPVAETLQRLNIERAFVTVWFDPRSYDSAFAERVKLTPQSDRASVESIARIWSAVDHFAIHADLDDSLRIHISTRLNETKLPGLVSGILPFSTGQTSLWTAVPPDALVAVAGRIAVASMLSKADELSKATSSSPSSVPSSSPSKDVANLASNYIGKDKFQTVLEALGPDWGLWVTSPEHTDAWTPDWTFAIRIRPDPTGKINTAEALFSGVESGAHYARIAYNHTHSSDQQLDLKDVTVAGVKVRSFSGKGLPPGMRPSFAIRGEYFLFASSAERIAKFNVPAADAGTATESPLIRISGIGLREYLKKHSGAISQSLSTIQKRDVDEVKEEIGHFVDILEPIERVDVTAVQNNGITRLSVSLTPRKSLKK